jgi:hypothetical protein
MRPDGPIRVRVTLTLDSAEAAALGMVAGAAVDASVMLADMDMIDESVVQNAQQILAWAIRAAGALEILEQGPGTNAEE